MRVFILRSEGVDEALAERLLELLSRFQGPARFQIATDLAPAIGKKNKDKFGKKRPDPEEGQWTKDHKEHLEANIDLNLSRKSAIHFMKPEPDPPVSWDALFNVCESYRQSYCLHKADWVVLLTRQRNELNWFSANDPRNPRNSFIHTDEWGLYVNCDPVYPIAYEIATTLMVTFMFHDYYELEAYTHQIPRGCMMDMCANKKDVSLKMRTADLCTDCQRIIARRKVNPLLVQQVLRIIDSIRHEILFKQRFDVLDMPSRLEVRGYNRDIVFPDMAGLTLQLTPRQKAVYLVFLAHPEGIAFHELSDHHEEFRRHYGRLGSFDNLAALSHAVDELLAYDGPISTEISRINKKLREALGEELSKPYRIVGPNGGKRAIALDRKYISFTE